MNNSSFKIYILYFFTTYAIHKISVNFFGELPQIYFY